MKELIIKVVLILALIVVGISLVACAPDPDYISSADDISDPVIMVEEDYTKWDLGWGGYVYRIFDEEFNNICYVMDNDTSDDMICFDLGED